MTTKQKLDKLFSTYIRKKAANHQGLIRCYTCNRLEYWRDVDAGHFVTRQHLSLRWDERNVKPQCKKCNRFQSGVSDEFALHLVRNYGVGILEELNKAKWIPTKMGEFEMLALLKEYKEKLDNLV